VQGERCRGKIRCGKGSERGSSGAQRCR
jgi:hypothetical protein